jgi:hypothetical protein
VPWTETSSQEQRVQFIRECQKSETSMAAPCRAFGISQQTGYKWVRRYFEFEEEGDHSLLHDRIGGLESAWLGERYTMPAAIRSDNGPPFASTGAGVNHAPRLKCQRSLRLHTTTFRRVHIESASLGRGAAADATVSSAAPRAPFSIDTPRRRLAGTTTVRGACGRGSQRRRRQVALGSGGG